MSNYFIADIDVERLKDTLSDEDSYFMFYEEFYVKLLFREKYSEYFDISTPGYLASSLYFSY